MGSKRWMLQNGLGDLIAKEVRGAGRFIDLFSGSGAVASHVATKYNVPVKAYDLQMFGAVLANAVLQRKRELDVEGVWAGWYERAKKLRLEASRPPSASRLNRKRVEACRLWCGKQTWPITKSYGGHYFSPRQAVWLDALRRTLPKRDPERTVALAALIRAASECAASPGHTAQPFQPTRRAKPFLKDAWGKDVVRYCRDALSVLSKQRAKVRGRAEVRDANEAARSIRKGDLVFVDPPYSGVHYSRFYHVLETLARGRCSEVAGTGRYPIPDERPWSRYSVKSESVSALDGLFAAVHARGGKAILTFPQRRCSNGLSGRKVTELARKHFAVEQHWVASKFSTLGGNNDHRDARHSARELMLVMRPCRIQRPKEKCKKTRYRLSTSKILSSMLRGS